MNMVWEELKYWRSDDWKRVEDRLNELDHRHISYNPRKSNIFQSLHITPFDSVKVAIIGQDPYPNPDHATGLAFSLPESYILGHDCVRAPQTWRNIKRELCTDLHIPSPETGSFVSWAEQGVLLWNAISTCESWIPLSHDWEEYSSLTQEIIQSLSKKESGVIFVFLGSKARSYLEYVKDGKVVCTSHPSPRGAYQSNPYLRIVPFIGSRIFSTTNAYLTEAKKEPIDWRL